MSASNIDIGKLNKRITFQTLSTESGDLGEKVKWKDYVTVWATVKPYKSSEYNFMGKLKPEVTHRFYVRYRDDITPDMRIVYHGQTFNIAGYPLDMDEAHRMLEIQAERVFESVKYSG